MCACAQARADPARRPARPPRLFGPRSDPSTDGFGARGTRPPHTNPYCLEGSHPLRAARRRPQGPLAPDWGHTVTVLFPSSSAGQGSQARRRRRRRRGAGLPLPRTGGFRGLSIRQSTVGIDAPLPVHKRFLYRLPAQRGPPQPWGTTVGRHYSPPSRPARATPARRRRGRPGAAAPPPDARAHTPRGAFQPRAWRPERRPPSAAARARAFMDPPRARAARRPGPTPAHYAARPAGPARGGRAHGQGRSLESRKLAPASGLNPQMAFVARTHARRHACRARTLTRTHCPAAAARGRRPAAPARGRGPARSGRPAICPLHPGPSTLGRSGASACAAGSRLW